MTLRNSFRTFGNWPHSFSGPLRGSSALLEGKRCVIQSVIPDSQQGVGCRKDDRAQDQAGDSKQPDTPEIFVPPSPVTLESEGELTRIHLTPRLTPHIRHAAKYIDPPVSAGKQFVFWKNVAISGKLTRTLHELTSVPETWPATAFRDHLNRGDVSQRIADVFGDYLPRNIESHRFRVKPIEATSPSAHDRPGPAAGRQGVHP